MLNFKNAFSGFSVDDIAQAKTFYSEALGLKVTEEKEGLRLHLSDGAWVFVYPKPNHEPASFTILNFNVEDIEKAVQELKEKGVTFEHYPDLGTDDQGIARHEGQPPIAWFKDPAGNVLSVIQI